MGVTLDHALGRNLKFFVKDEVTAGTFIKPVATDAAKVLSTNFDFQQERRPRMDNRQSRSLIERITGKGTVSWEIESYVITGASVGAQPDLGPLYHAAMGGTPSGSSYTLSDSQTCRTVSLVRHANEVWQEQLAGAWVNTMEISASGGDEPKIKFAGGAMDFIHTGTSTLDADMTTSTALSVLAADDANFDIGSVIKIGTEDNSSAGFDITADGTVGDGDFTIGDQVTSQLSGVDVVPFVPAETVTGNLINGISGSVTHNSDALIVTGFTVTLDNAIKPFDDEAQTRLVSDLVPGYRSVTGTLNVRARKDWIIHHADRKDYGQVALVIYIGGAAGSQLKINMPQIELDFAAVDVPSDAEANLVIPFTALSSSDTAIDELDLDFD